MPPAPLPLWAKVLDQTRCIGCHACTTACKSENQVPVGVSRTYVKSVDVGQFPRARRAFQVTRCNQCDDPPCVAACPTRAMVRRPDGIVDFDKAVCIGCKACIAACPYDAIFINPADHSAEKCNFCAHRLESGLEPACVIVCPTQAILVGDLRDPSSAVAALVHRQPVAVRGPEKGTRPKVFYRGAAAATLDPLAAERARGTTFAWSQVERGAHLVEAGHPGGGPTSSAAAIVSYDVAHAVPWGWRVSLYTWTKGLAAGAYLVPILLAAIGQLGWRSPLVRLAGPAIAMGALAATAGLLIWDLKHPWRFPLLFLRPQWRSWLVRGGVILTAYGAVLAVQLDMGIAVPGVPSPVLMAVGGPVAGLAAVYTAYLFAQARARDLWQSPLLAPHLLVQAALAGSAALVIAATWVAPSAVEPLADVLAGTCALHLLLTLAEARLGHPSAHAQQAMGELWRGRFAAVFWPAAALVAVGALAPAFGWGAALCGLAGLLGYEHAFVQAGQAVPLA